MIKISLINNMKVMIIIIKIEVKKNLIIILIILIKLIRVPIKRWVIKIMEISRVSKTQVKTQ